MKLQPEAAGNEYEKLKAPEVVSYSMYSVASTMMFSVVGSVLTYFYTNVIGINMLMVGVIMTISRVFDGVSDLTMGTLIEKTHSKLGKARCWVLWMAIPYSLAIVLLFCVPAQASQTIQAIFVFLSYNFSQTICYTAIIMATGTLSQMMTRDRDSRSQLSIWRSIFMSVSQFIVTGYTIRWANALGGDQAAYIRISMIYAVVALISLLWVFFGCKERVVRAETVTDAEGRHVAKAVPMYVQFKALAKNKYFWMMTIATFGLYVYLTLYGTNLAYYCKYVLQNVNLTSTLSLALYASAIGCLFLLTPLVRRFGKTNCCRAAMAVAACGSIILLLIPEKSIGVGVMVIVVAMWGVGKSTINGTQYACVADAVEYSDWKYGVRSEGVTHSASSFGGKLGTGVGTMLVTGFLSMAGYDGTLATQSVEAVNMIRNLMIYGTLIIWAGLFVLYLFYKLDKIFPTIQKELMERNQKKAQSS